MLHKLSPAHGSKKSPKRVARGNSAGGGTTGGRGTKGQQSRVGKGRRFGFEGGQTPLIRRQPKLGGFTPPRQKKFVALDIASLEKNLAAGTYSTEQLRAAGMSKGNTGIKLLGKGPLTKKFDLTVAAASKGAKDAIIKAGGKITIA